MYIEHAYQQTQQVWPVEYEDQPTLLTSLESAEQYTHEHGEPSSTPPEGSEVFRQGAGLGLPLLGAGRHFLFFVL